MGAFLLPTDWMGTAGPLGAIIAMPGGELLCLIAVSDGILIRTYPVFGGEYAVSGRSGAPGGGAGAFTVIRNCYTVLH